MKISLLPLLASVAPELLLLTLLSPGAQHEFSLQGPLYCPLTHTGGAAELTTYKDQPSC